MPKKSKPGPWVSTAIAARELGVSAKFLLAHRGDLFKKAIHWRVKNPNAWRPTYTWHLKRCEAHFEKLMEDVD